MNVLNVLIAGHRPDRLPQGEAQDAVRAGLGMAVNALADFTKSKNTRLRILTGDATGTDAWAQEFARQGNHELWIAGVQRSADSAQAPESSFWLTDADVKNPADSRQYGAIDEAKLFYADLLLVVWDGGVPAGTHGGTVRLLIEAVRQYKPVLWVDARPESPGRLRWFDFFALEAPAITLVDVHESNVRLLHTYFFDLSEKAEDLANRLGTLLKPHLSPEGSGTFERLIERWDPGEAPVRAGWLHSAILRPFGYPRFEGGRYTSWIGKGFELAFEPYQEHYQRLDRAAVKASYVHRDQVVVTHLFAALAVFMAIAGIVGSGAFWGIAEFAVLTAILVIVWRDRRRSVTAHKAYLALRHGAETFRALALLRLFLASLPRIERNQWLSEQKEGEKRNHLVLRTPQTWWVIRHMRNVGPPKNQGKKANPAYTLACELRDLQNLLCHFIKDQREYHEKTHKRWHKIHQRIEKTMKFIFGLAMASVLAHLFALGIHHAEHHGWLSHSLLTELGHGIHEYSLHLLFFTAFGPALAASLHGIAGKLELARLATHSRVMASQLAVLEKAVSDVDASNQENLFSLRALAQETASVIYAEHEAWVELLHGQDLDIPA